MGPHEYARMNGKMLIWQEWEERPSTEEKWNDYLVNLLNTPMPVEQYTARATVARKYYAEWQEEEAKRKAYQKPRSLGFSVKDYRWPPSHDMTIHNVGVGGKNEDGLYFLSGTGKSSRTGVTDSFAKNLEDYYESSPGLNLNPDKLEEFQEAFRTQISGIDGSRIFPLVSGPIQFIKTETTVEDTYSKLRMSYNTLDPDHRRFVNYWRELCDLPDTYPDVDVWYQLNVSFEAAKRTKMTQQPTLAHWIVGKYNDQAKQDHYDSMNGKSKSSINNERRKASPSGQDNQSVRTDLDGREGSERGEIIRRESSQSEIATETRFRGDAVAIGRRPVDVRCVTTRTTFFYQEHPYCQGKGSVPYEWLK